MVVSFFEVENILNTLPIGYYVHRKLDVILSETSEGSFYEPMHDRITISYKMIADVLVKFPDDTEIEETVRTLIYHETSHAILTPKNMEINDIINIFEDERIETLLSKFYLHTDFKKLVKQVNDFKGEKPKTAIEAFYQTVRYRIGKPEFVKRVQDIIVQFKSLNHSTRYTRDYTNAIKDLYADILADFAVNSLAEEQNANTQTLSQTTASEPSDNTIELDDVLTPETVDELIAESLNANVDNEIIEQTQAILSRVSKATSRNGSAINAYSGVFDPRSVARNDYKYFVQQNRNGHVKAFSKTHLNLFIDRSGSFCCSEQLANKLIYALHLFEKTNPDFTFDLITCGVGERIEPKHDRELKCNGGNLLDEQIFEIFKAVQKPSQSNYNIVLFDGDAFSDTWSMKKGKKEYYKNFGAFNVNNCTIISDNDNASHLRCYCKNAKVIITYNYVEELIKNVMTALQSLTR